MKNLCFFFQARELNDSMILDMQAINELIELFDKELNDMKRQANDGYLKIKPEETVEFLI